MQTLETLEDHDVVVVGAGLAGVVAARSLARSGLRVLVLEGRDRVGGRLLTVHTRSGHAVDLGGQWIGPGQRRVLALADELGIATHPTRHRGKTCFELEGEFGASRVGVPWRRPLTLFGLVLAMSRIEKLARGARESPPWLGDPPRDGGDMSIGAFVAEHVWPRGARVILRSVFEGVFCRDPDEVSLDLALYAIAAGGGFAHMQAVEGGAQERQFTDGAAPLVKRLAAELEGRIRLGARVRRVEQTDAHVRVQADGLSVRAKHAVIAIPPQLVARLEFAPPLDPRRMEIMSAAKMGSVVKCRLVYRNAFWNEAGLSGAIWSTSGPVNVCYDTTPPGSEAGILSALCVAKSADDLAGLSADQRRDSILHSLASHLGPAARAPVEYLDLVWQSETLSEGGYSVTLPPGKFWLGPAAFRKSEGLIHFAGTETASEYPGYIEGAVESGERVARDILALRTAATVQSV